MSRRQTRDVCGHPYDSIEGRHLRREHGVWSPEPRTHDRSDHLDPAVLPPGFGRDELQEHLDTWHE